MGANLHTLYAEIDWSHHWPGMVHPEVPTAKFSGLVMRLLQLVNSGVALRR